MLWEVGTLPQGDPPRFNSLSLLSQFGHFARLLSPSSCCFSPFRTLSHFLLAVLMKSVFRDFEEVLVISVMPACYSWSNSCYTSSLAGLHLPGPKSCHWWGGVWYRHVCFSGPKSHGPARAQLCEQNHCRCTAPGASPSTDLSCCPSALQH